MFQAMFQTQLQPADVVILVFQQQLLRNTDTNSVFFSANHVEPFVGKDARYLKVEAFGEGICYVCVCNEVDTSDELSGYRELLVNSSEEEAMLVSRALQLVTWSQQNRFCGQCGEPTVSHKYEQALQCVPCSITHYPRISPCIMCLIVDGDRCLLAHHARYKNNMYSTLAGFVEAGETLEHAVHREIKEEVNIEVNNLRYFSSQSWPYPYQLMIGYVADYAGGDIQEDNVEIKDAQWFRYDDLPTIPNPETLSGQLINAFVAECVNKSK